jgi:hypothetical protein
MGHKCNERYKLSQDILRKGDGSRRRAFYPYGTPPAVTISLVSSIPFSGDDGHTPNWTIDFLHDGEEVDTWNEVFRIRERYVRDILNPQFKPWLTEFAAWIGRKQLAIKTKAALLRALTGYVEFQEACGLNDRSFIKAAVFRMLLRHCRAGDKRLIQLLCELPAV